MVVFIQKGSAYEIKRRACVLPFKCMKFRATIHKEGVPDVVQVIEAPSRFAVYDQVQKEGGTVVELTEGAGRSRLRKILSLTIGRGVKNTEIIQMTKNLSAMIRAGLSLERSLSVIERQTRNKRLKKVAAGLAGSIRKGSSFHDALSAYPRVFPPLFIAMARAGEESGSLADALTVVGTQMEHSEGIVRKIKGAMIYPSIVISAVLIVGILMLIYVVPTLTNTFEQLHVAVPFATQVIVGISDFMIAHVFIVFAALAIVIVGGITFFRSHAGGTVAIAVSLRLPVIGTLVRETYSARAARTLSSLLAAGVPVLNALSITREVVHAHVFAKVIQEAEVRVKKGEPLSAPFAEHTKLYPILMGEMLAVGEETGRVADMLKQIAEFYEESVSEKTKDLSTIIEPLLILFIGACVGIFAVSMIQPIYSLSSAF